MAWIARPGRSVLPVNLYALTSAAVATVLSSPVKSATTAISEMVTGVVLIANLTKHVVMELLTIFQIRKHATMASLMERPAPHAALTAVCNTAATQSGIKGKSAMRARRPKGATRTAHLQYAAMVIRMLRSKTVTPAILIHLHAMEVQQALQAVTFLRVVMGTSIWSLARNVRHQMAWTQLPATAQMQVRHLASLLRVAMAISIPRQKNANLSLTKIAIACKSVILFSVDVFFNV